MILVQLVQQERLALLVPLELLALLGRPGRLVLPEQRALLALLARRVLRVLLALLALLALLVLRALLV